VAAGVGEEHEGEQAGDLAVVGEAAVEIAGQADGLAGEVAALQGGAAAAVALAEAEVEDVEDGGEAGGASRRGWAGETGRRSS
jgi:hypothetical protein